MMKTRFARVLRAPAASAVLALAVAGGAMGAAAPAAAKEKASAPKANYSKPFIAAYSPVDTLIKSTTPDIAAAKAAVPGVIAAVQTDDDRFAAGNLLLTIGQKAQDNALQLQGVEMMIASNKAAADKVGLLNFSAGQLAYNAKDFAKARGFFEAAMAGGYVQNEPEALIAETYFNEDKYADGVTYLSKVIAARKAAGQPVSEAWIKRGLAMAYNNKLNSDANRYALMYAADYPSDKSWGDAVAILLNTSDYQAPETLDLLRLARRTGSFRDAIMFREYLDAADYRRLPTEVLAVIDEGKAKGFVKTTDTYIADMRTQAAARVAADKRDVPALARDARAANANLTTIMAAGDTLLSMGNGAEAEEFYTKALATAGVNTPLVLTRLGIAQFDQGKYAEAQTTFAKVEGARQAIASLWAVYARQKGAPAAP